MVIFIYCDAKILGWPTKFWILKLNVTFRLLVLSILENAHYLNSTTLRIITITQIITP